MTRQTAAVDGCPVSALRASLNRADLDAMIDAGGIVPAAQNKEITVATRCMTEAAAAGRNLASRIAARRAAGLLARSRRWSPGL